MTKSAEVFRQEHGLQKALLRLEEAAKDTSGVSMLDLMTDTTIDPHTHTNRDYDDPDPMHGISIGYKALDPRQQTQFAERLGQVLDLAPEQNLPPRIEKTRPYFDKKTATKSLLRTAQMVANPAVLAEPLYRMYERKSLKQEYKFDGIPARSYLAHAIAPNQIDSRFKNTWFAMLDGDENTYFHEGWLDFETGLVGILHMPESPQTVGTPQIYFVQEALSKIAQRIDDPTLTDEHINWEWSMYHLIDKYPNKPDWRTVVHTDEIQAPPSLQKYAADFLDSWYEDRERYDGNPYKLFLAKGRPAGS